MFIYCEYDQRLLSMYYRKCSSWLAEVYIRKKHNCFNGSMNKIPRNSTYTPDFSSFLFYVWDFFYSYQSKLIDISNIFNFKKMMKHLFEEITRDLLTFAPDQFTVSISFLQNFFIWFSSDIIHFNSQMISC